MRKVHWAHCSPYAVARAIMEQHGVDWDQAFRMAWYGMRKKQIACSPAQALSRMEQVQNVPDVPESVMLVFQLHLQDIITGRERVRME